MTQADLGLADAYINGDFSFVDKDEGLLNLFMVSYFLQVLFASLSVSTFNELPFIIYAAGSHCQ